MHYAAFVPLLATALALPASEVSKSGEPIARTHQFGIYLEAEEPYNNLPLVATQSGVVGSKYLTFERPSAYRPTNAFLNGTADQLNFPQDFAYLDFLSDDKFDLGDIYGANLPKAGDAPGVVQDVKANRGAQNAAWKLSADAKYLNAKLDAAPNSFFACNTTIVTKAGNFPVFGLSWGNTNLDGSAPKGCVKAKLRAVDDSFGSTPP